MLRQSLGDRFAPYDAYVRQRKMPLWDKACLFESAVGKNINGNMFALMREMCANEAYAKFEIVFAVTEGMLDKAQARFDAYGMQRVKLVVEESSEYNEYLARAKYLWNDDTFPAYFTKRPEQVYVNTWHGSGPKRLGLGDIANSLRSFANVQKNLLTADYDLYPSEFTRDAFMRDYDLAPFYEGTILLHDYPRNDVLANLTVRERVREEQNYSQDTQVIAYMPTWRGTARTVDDEDQVSAVKEQFEAIDDRLRDDQLLLVNLHFLVSSQLTYEDYKHIRPFPTAYETYDVLSACDVLISDYSSVVFDFAVTNRPIVLFAYDEEEYLADHGTFLPYHDLPFPIVHTVQELMDVLQPDLPAGGYDDFRSTFCAYHTGHATCDLLEYVLHGEDGNVKTEKCNPAPIDEALYVCNLGKRRVYEAVASEIRERGRSGAVLITTATFSQNAIEALEELHDHVHILFIVRRRVQTVGEKALFGLARRSALLCRLLSPKLQECFAREAGQLLCGVTPKQVRALAPDGSYFMWAAKGLDCERVACMNVKPFGKRTLAQARVCAAQGYQVEG